MVDVVDFRRFSAVTPREATLVRDDGLAVAVGRELVVGSAGEEQLVGVGGTLGCPVRAVVDLGVIPGLQTVRPGAAAVARVADDALIGCRDARLTAQIEAVVPCGPRTRRGSGSRRRPT